MQVARTVMHKQIGCDVIYKNMDSWIKSTAFHFIKNILEEAEVLLVEVQC